MNEILIAYYEGLPLQVIGDMLYVATKRGLSFRHDRWFIELTNRPDFLNFMLPVHNDDPHWVNPERETKSNSSVVVIDYTHCEKME